MSGGDVLTNMPEADAIRSTELFILRQISDLISAQSKRMDTVVEKVDDVRERLVALEEQKKEIESLNGSLSKALSRIDALESQRDRALGMRDLGAWLLKHAPWLLGGIAAFVAGKGLGQQ